MGEDSCRNVTVDKKTTSDCHTTNGIYNGHHNNMNGFTVSSCSEADSESTTYIGDIEENMDDQDYQYGPGIVSKLRTKFLSISMKQSRGGMNTMRRSCSLEDILEPKTPVSPTNIFVSANKFSANGESKILSSAFSNLKRAKSMDTLLLSVTEEQRSNTFNNEICINLESRPERIPKVIRKKDGPLTRSNVSICDEELPKPDTVKTYKRMFEPAESKKTNINSNVRRRPPVLRATAKSGSTFTTKSPPGLSPKVNGTLSNPLPAIRSSPTTFKSKFSAKEGNVKDSNPKLISNLPQNELKKIEDNKNATLLNNNSVNTIVTKKESSPTVNGFVKAEPVKFKQKEDPIKRNFRTKNLDGQRLSKPAVPANKPSLISPKPKNLAAKMLERKNNQNKTSPLPKQTSPKTEILEKPILKPILSKHIEKTTVSANNKIEIAAQDTESTLPSAQSSVKPIIENGVQKTNIQKDLSTKIETQHLVNGFSKSEPVEQIITSQQVIPISTSKKVPPIERSSPSTLQNDLTKDNVIRKTNTVKPTALSNGQNSIVFDFRGKDVATHLAIIPAPFGCRKAAPAAKKRSILLDGKEPYALNGLSNGDTCTDEDDDDYVDYSVPPPCGLSFEGENIKVGKGAILITRNKDLKIQFDEDVGNNTFVYPSESSYLSDDSSSISSSDLSSLEDSNTKLTNGVVPAAKLRSNTAIGSNGVGGLMSYTPSVLRTVDNFQPGIFRIPEKDDSKLNKKENSEGEEENRERREKEQNGGVEKSDSDSEMLKPADPEFISSWSLSANTSDLLF